MPYFVRYWYEIPHNKIGFNFTTRAAAAKSRLKWFPYVKAGGYRKWSWVQHVCCQLGK